MKQLENALQELKIPFSDEMLKKFNLYMKGILEWNDKVNITSITDEEEFIEKHFIDSILCVPYDEFKRSTKIIDVGTGGGFPGIPLALAAPDKQFVLIDSLNKRIKIINELCASIGIRNVKAIHSRAEEAARMKEHREKYDLCVSRAVANLATLSEYCLPFIKQGGYFLAYKGPDIEQEIKESKRALGVLGGEIKRQETSLLEDFYLKHKILFIEKTAKTPSKYPRKAGTPSKEPLK